MFSTITACTVTTTYCPKPTDDCDGMPDLELRTRLARELSMVPSQELASIHDDDGLIEVEEG